MTTLLVSADLRIVLFVKDVTQFDELLVIKDKKHWSKNIYIIK